MKGGGGRRRHSILSKNWTLKIPEDGKDHEEMAKLQQQVKSLKGIVKASTRILHEIQETPTRRKRTNKHYSKRHEYRIKRQRVTFDLRHTRVKIVLSKCYKNKIELNS